MATNQKDGKPDNTFPRAVYRKGTGKQVNEGGLYEAESTTVYDEQQLAKMGGEWVASPQEAATGSKDKDTSAVKPTDKK